MWRMKKTNRQTNLLYTRKNKIKKKESCKTEKKCKNNT